MGFDCGIVGLPNVGKSTLFNAITAAGAAVANYPFCTVEPNRGVTPIPDERLRRLAEATSPAKVTPTTMEFLDIAGLVAGAHQGEGLGNQFLSHIRTVDALVHVVRAFADTNVSHVLGGADPLRDADVVETELLLADLAQLDRRFEKVDKMVKVGEKSARAEHAALSQLRVSLDAGTAARFVEDVAARAAADQLGLLTAKPVIYVVNVSESGLHADPPGVSALREKASREGAEVLTICADIEAEILQIEDPDERKAFYDDMGLEETGLYQVIRAGYSLLGLITFYTTVGPELRAWTIRDGTAAPGAAGRIHTDFERGFIRAEVIHWEDFDRLGSEHAVKDAGLLHVEGRDYVVRDGDIVRFRFNV